MRSSGNAPTTLRRKPGPFGVQRQTVKEISSTIYQTRVDTGVGAIPIAYEDDVPAMVSATFFAMNPRTTVGVGTNTLNSLGVWATRSQEAASLVDPMQRTYLALKVDHQGFNACNVQKFNEYCNEFQFIKQDAYVVEITFTDQPMNSKNAPPATMTRPSRVTNTQLTQQQQTLLTPGGQVAPSALGAVPVFMETRPFGGWYYIIVPPQRGASINLTEIGTEVAWQRLLNIGYKAKPCSGKKYRIQCGTNGFDASGRQQIITKLAGLGTSGGVVPVNNGGANLEGRDNATHQIQEAEWCCQYADPAGLARPPTYATATTYTRNTVFQGFDTLPFGSAIVFQFCQYAPLTIEGGNTAVPTVIPYQIEILSATSFSQLRLGNRDVGQVCTLPIAGP